MLDKLSLLLKSKIALAAVGATLVAGGGASVAAAATGAHIPIVSQALHAATGTHDANDDKGQDAAGHDANDDKGHDGATATPGAGHDANDDNGQDANDNDADGNGQDANDNDADDANEFEATGSVVSVDTAGSSFMLKQSDGSTVQVTASSTTIFDGGLTMLGDLKAGMTVEVKGAKQSDGSVAASRVHGEDANADQSGSGSSDGSGSGSSGGSGSGSGSSGGSGSGSGSSGGSGSGSGSSGGSGSDDGHGGNG
jgi:uncharacterized protein DUF5666